MKLLPLILLFLISCTTGFFALPVQIPEENGTIQVFFCDQTDCLQVLKVVSENKSIQCAMYHTSPEFLELNISLLIVDGDHPIDGAIIEQGFSLMHDKFCTIGDNLVWTGSWNPSQRMTIPNNVVLIQSRTLAQAYRSELNELARGTFHGGTQEPGLVRLNGEIMESYFCPEDKCAKQVMHVLENAKKTIHFMTYSFTDDSIGNLLLLKNESGVEVKGLFDPRKDKYSEYNKLSKISQITKLHHKVFIIDGHTVITGSYNPTRNADERNDENILIIRDLEIAKQFEEEFERLTLSVRVP